MNIVSEFKYQKMISMVQLWADKLYTNWLKHKTAHSLNICSFFVTNSLYCIYVHMVMTYIARQWKLFFVGYGKKY